MARIKKAQALAAGTWTLLFDQATDGGTVSEFVVENDAGSANAVEVLAVPLHLTADGTPGAVDGAVIGVGVSRSFAQRNAAGGALRQVWAKSAGATVNAFVTVG